MSVLLSTSPREILPFHKIQEQETNKAKVSPCGMPPEMFCYAPMGEVTEDSILTESAAKVQNGFATDMNLLLQQTT